MPIGVPLVSSLRLGVCAALRIPDPRRKRNAPATWTDWLGCVGRAPEGQRARSRASPFLPVPPPSFLPAIRGGLQGGYSPHASAALKRKTTEPDTNSSPINLETSGNPTPKRAPHLNGPPAELHSPPPDQSWWYLLSSDIFSPRSTHPSP